MMMQQRQYQRQYATEKPPSDLDYGKLEWKSVGIYVAMILGGALVGGALLLVAILIWPKDYDVQWSAYRVVGVGAPGAAGAACFLFASVVAYRVLRGWQQHQAWIAQLRKHWLESSKAREGLAVNESGTEFTLRPSRINDLIIAVVAIQAAVERGEPTPWGVRVLRGDDGPLGLADGNRATYFGSFSPRGAEEAAKTLEQAGLIAGRKQGHGGRWVPQDLGEAIQMVIKGVR